MYETYVTVQGRLVADPVVKQGRSGAFTVFRVAQSERHPDRSEPGRWTDSEPSFYDVSVFRGMGENAARSLRKGHPVVVTGKQRIRQFRRDDGSMGATVELFADSLGHDLRWGVTHYTRNGDLAPALPGGPGPDGFGDPEHDAYVVRDEPGVGVPGAAAAAVAEQPALDSGPLVRPDDERAA
ncbi:single-stranded DNA-binding protein [Phycicoccus sonneratiae]|uniref:Single-stranded DNA-binding protein n=1 Tax=Phycicoccus sonneratiae TaxID=2807628 RepID=A0ABS2CGV5_9MICO|nr:single-stranded DNA-binding protein [Phycicoccus sonneraticus]MBM6399108.1 single-stranded DNA-binding protein [Phycicoccus sonneraticus]